MQQQPRLPLWFLLVNCGLIATAFVAGAMLGGQRHAEFPQPQSDALQVIYRKILEDHVEQQDGQVLLDRALAAMAGGLDDYSRYVPPSEVERYEENTTGRYEGVGMVMRQHDEDIVVHFPFANGPADRAGIKPGDKLVAIDGTRTADLPAESRNTKATELVRGPADTEVALQFDRDGDLVETLVQRASVQRPAVKWVHIADAERGFGYIHVTDFHRGVTQGVGDAIAALQKSAPLRGLVIDLRWNGGGNLDECVAMARMFQPTGTIVSTRRRGSEIKRRDSTPEDCRYPDLPLVLLVNADSASASEVLAGCLQDHDRATVVGLRTYGKGVVNTVYSWPDFKLKLTTAHYYTPNGRSLGGSHRTHGGNHGGNQTAPETGIEPGIEPDVSSPATDEQQRDFWRTLSQHEVPAAHRESFAIAAQKYEIDVPVPPNAESDAQLATALEELDRRVVSSNGK